MTVNNVPKRGGVLRRVGRNLRWGWIVLKQSRQQELPTRYVLAQILFRLKLNERMTFEYFGARFRLFNTSVSQVMFYNPSRWHGARDMCFLRKLVRAGDTIVDIGANVGSHAIPLAKALGTTSPVYAFEPHPRTFAYLQANAALNQLPNLHLYNFALGESEGEVAFTDEKNDDLNRVSTHGSGAIIVPVKPLDSIECLDQAAITLLKVDVEGYELFVLRGASKALQRTEFIFLEANTRHSQEFGTTVQDLAGYLHAQNWTLYRVSDPQTLMELPEAPHVDDWENWLATRDVALLRERLEGQGVQLQQVS
jgi:FkbM family methyltransferase